MLAAGRILEHASPVMFEVVLPALGQVNRSLWMVILAATTVFLLCRFQTPQSLVTADSDWNKLTYPGFPCLAGRAKKETSLVNMTVSGDLTISDDPTTRAYWDPVPEHYVRYPQRENCLTKSRVGRTYAGSILSPYCGHGLLLLREELLPCEAFLEDDDVVFNWRESERHALQQGCTRTTIGRDILRK